MLDYKNHITFVCCIEYGRLEKQTVLMATTFRKNAGRFANCRLMAVVGRKGAAISKTTLDLLMQLDVELIYAERDNPVSWFHYANKIVAVGVAQRLATTPLVAWLDSDLLFLGEPSSYLLAENEAFAASLEFFPPAVVEDESKNQPYWEKLCSVIGVKFESLPIIENELNFGKKQRLYFTSGIFVWRKNTAFADAYRQAFIKVIQSKIALSSGAFFQNDQVILSPVVVMLALKWRLLNFRDQHITVSGQINGDGASQNMQDSNVLHYSQSLSFPFRTAFIKRLEQECPKVLAFINSNDKLELKRNYSDLMIAKWYKYYRAIRWKIFGWKIVKVNK
jgi:hypothetical protein